MFTMVRLQTDNGTSLSYKCDKLDKLVSKMGTLGSLINVRVLIIVRVGKFGQNNKHTGPNKHTV